MTAMTTLANGNWTNRTPNHVCHQHTRLGGALLAALLILCSGCAKESLNVQGNPQGLTNENDGDSTTSPSSKRRDEPSDTNCTTTEECGDQFCVKGVCRAWECEDDSDCLESGSLARCDQSDYRCVICEANDINCLGVECTQDTHCSDFDNCTEDSCADGNTCDFIAIDGCCTEDSECDDGVACTLDQCKQASCSHTPQDNTCCTTDEHCGDGNSCTTDLCMGQQCIHPHTGTEPNCQCAAYVECDDSNPCSQDRCTDGACQHIPLDEEDPGDTQGGAICCAQNADCDDGNPATNESCVHQQCVETESSECSSNEDCEGGGDCTAAICTNGHCVVEVLEMEGCCIEASDCTLSEICTTATCENNSCVIGTSPNADVLWSENFDEVGKSIQELGWSVENDGSGAYWQNANILSASCLCFGTPGCQGFDVGHTSGSATTKEIVLPADRVPRLSFEIATEIEGGGGTDPNNQKDWFSVDILSNSETRIFQKTDMDPEANTALKWLAFKRSLEAYKGQTIRIKFGFNSGDAISNEGAGVFVDDIRLTLDCP